MTEITEEKAHEMNAAWDAGGLVYRLTADRVNWITTDTTTYFVTRPSELEKRAAKRIVELEDALQPFAAAVYRDNGDVTITHVDHGNYLRAKRLLTKG